MKTRKLRLLSALLALAMMLALLPTAAFAVKEGYYEYDVDSEGNATITWYDHIDGPREEIEIPDTLGGHWVTKIDNIDNFYGSGILGAFSNMENLTGVTIPDSVVMIGTDAFKGCYNLSRIKLSANLEKIGHSAFVSAGIRSAGISQITIPAKVKEIESYAFWGCKLTDITFEQSSQLTTIGNSVFASNHVLSSIEIPNNVTSIGWNAFAYCEKLENVTFAPGSQLKTVGENIFKDCSDSLIIYYSDKNVKQALTDAGVSADKIRPTNPTVTFVSNGGTEVESKTVTNGEKASKPADPTRDGWNFAGWYTKDADGTWAAEPFDFNTAITDDMTLYARWATEWAPITPATPLYPITIDYGTAYDADHNAITKAAAGEKVYLEADETAFDGMVFEYWKDHEGNVTLVNDHAAKTSFTMPDGEVHLEAMYKAADNDDTSWDAATVVTGVAIGTGTAILAYHIGTELYAEQVLGKGVAVPRTRADVALLAWRLAGSPAVELNGEPLSEAAQAEKWAVESGLMQLDAEGNFNGAKKMSKLKALRVLEKAQKLN